MSRTIAIFIYRGVIQNHQKIRLSIIYYDCKYENYIYVTNVLKLSHDLQLLRDQYYKI
jgi:hypothetical protein